MIILAPDTVIVDRIYCLSSPIDRRRLLEKPFKEHDRLLGGSSGSATLAVTYGILTMALSLNRTPTLAPR
jgi:hypothetical protein